VPRTLTIAACLVLLIGCSRSSRQESESTKSGTVTETTDRVSPARVEPGTPSQPAWPADFPDPSVVWDNGWYHAYATQGSYGLIQKLRSTDLVTWELEDGGALAEVPVWADPFSVWAPAVAPTDDGWLLYYTARETASGLQCIARAHAPDLDQPFTDESVEPLVCPREQGGAIDPSPVVGDDGAFWLLWKNDGVAIDVPSSIYVQPLTADGRAIAGPPVRLIGTDQPWEDPHVEAPSMIQDDNGRWILLYSASWWNQPSYGVGVAICDDITGPCTKPLSQPLIAAQPGMAGPGGAEWFRDAVGNPWIAYHGWLGVPGFPSRRALWLDRADPGAVPDGLVVTAQPATPT
jgi:beta-xylosidase